MMHWVVSCDIVEAHCCIICEHFTSMLRELLNKLFR